MLNDHETYEKCRGGSIQSHHKKNEENKLEGERERKRQRQRQRETDRQTDRHNHVDYKANKIDLDNYTNWNPDTRMKRELRIPD